MSITEKYKGKIIKKVSNTGVPKEEYNALTTQITLLEAQVNNLTTELAGKVTPAGDAVAGNVLKGKTFINSTGSTITGTMTDRGAKTFTPSASKQTGGAGYYSSVTCNAVTNLTAANIKKGVTVGGVAGSLAPATVTANGSSIVFTSFSYNYSQPIESLSNLSTSAYMYFKNMLFSYINGTIGIRIGACSRGSSIVGYNNSFMIKCTNISTGTSYTKEYIDYATGTSAVTNTFATPSCPAGFYKIEIGVSNKSITGSRGNYTSLHSLGLQLTMS